MGENNILSSVIAAFAQTSKAKWQDVASEETGGKNPFEELSWRNTDGLEFFPYYDIDDANKLSAKYRLPPSNDSVFGARKWFCTPGVTVADETNANLVSLEHLNAGADAIWFDLRDKSSVDFVSLLKDISWPDCSLFFLLSPSNGERLAGYLRKEGLLQQRLSGALYWTAAPAIETINTFAAATPSLKYLGVPIETSAPVQGIADALTQGVMLIKKFAARPDDIATLPGSVSFSLPVGTAFLETIAALKALRFLWYQVLRSYGVGDATSADVLIHATSFAWTPEAYQPHGNMIKATTAAAAAIMGGADALTIQAEDEFNRTMNRVARNVSLILREESHLNKVADPSAGAYAIDTMVDKFAKAAWERFQKNIVNAS